MDVSVIQEMLDKKETEFINWSSTEKQLASCTKLISVLNGESGMLKTT